MNLMIYGTSHLALEIDGSFDKGLKIMMIMLYVYALVNWGMIEDINSLYRFWIISGVEILLLRILIKRSR